MHIGRKPILALLLAIVPAGVAVAVPAPAQQVSQYPSPCDPSKVARSEVDRAHAVFLSGKEYLEESNYDKAISYFKDAYAIDCSVHGILPIIATAYERKGDRPEAVRALEEYLKRAPNASDRVNVERRINNLRDQIAQAAPSAAASSSAAGSAAPPPTEPSAAPSTQPEPPPAALKAARSEGNVAVSEQASGHTAGPWILAGIGGAAVVGGVVLYVVGAGDVSSAEADCPTRTCASRAVADEGNSGRTLETVGAVVGGVGLAAAAAGVLWHVLESPSTSSTGVHLAPVVTHDFAGASCVGAF